MLYRSGVKAVVLTLSLVLAVVCTVWLISLVFGLIDYFGTDRFLGILGAIGGLISVLTVAVRLFRNWILRRP